MLYTYVRNVEERGLVAFEEKRVGRRPPRKMYGLTAEGTAAFDTWLCQPVERMREVRIEFLLKLYFLHLHNPEGEMALLQRQIDICEAYRERLASRMEDADGFERLVMRSKVSAAESTGQWLREYAWELEQGFRNRKEVEAEL
jgi:PadR family transcriptional regulator AphA